MHTAPVLPDSVAEASKRILDTIMRQVQPYEYKSELNRHQIEIIKAQFKEFQNNRRVVSENRVCCISDLAEVWDISMRRLYEIAEC